MNRSGTAIPLGRASLRASRDQPGQQGETAPASRNGLPRFAAGCPYSVLLPVGFALPPPLPGARCALAAPFHPCPRPPGHHRWPTAQRAVCFLWHCPWGRPRRPLAGTVFPWSPDFPPPRPERSRAAVGTAAVQPSGPSGFARGARRRQDFGEVCLAISGKSPSPRQVSGSASSDRRTA